MTENPLAAIRKVWKNGELIPPEQASVHLLTHALHYGSGCFEGIRCYSTPDGPAVFRLREHMQRLEESCKVFRMELDFSVDEMCAAVLETIQANDLGACYVRPIAYRGFGSMGVNPLTCPVDVAIAAWPWGKYLGDEAQDEGVDVCVSTWSRPSPRTLPSNAKATGTYLNAQLIKMEAVLAGYSEGIALDANGQLSEGSGENVFLVRDGVLKTPPVSASILGGITRQTVITLARDLGIPFEEAVIPRGFLYTSDELFFTGTAVEVTPVRSVDRIPVGSGRPGPVTRRLLEAYLDTVEGRREDRHGWLTPVAQTTAV